MNRRGFTKKCLSISAGLLTAPNLVDVIEVEDGRLKKIPKTDTHVHLFDLDNLSYAWLKNAPEINRNFDLKDFRKATKKATIGKILFMESGADTGLGLKEAKQVSQLAKKESKIKGIIAKLDLSQGTKTEEELDQLAELQLLKGLRGGFPNNASTSADFLSGLKLLADRSLSFDLLLSPPQLEEAAIVAQKSPNNIFILDHLGNPNIKDATTTSQWKKGIQLLAQNPNVNCKISGIITKVGKDWTLEKIKPYILFVIEQFGMDRLVYGGDWPVVLRAGSYKSWSKAFEKITKQFSDNELHKIYHKNADRIYNL